MLYILYLISFLIGLNSCAETEKFEVSHEKVIHSSKQNPCESNTKAPKWGAQPQTVSSIETSTEEVENNSKDASCIPQDPIKIIEDGSGSGANYEASIVPPEATSLIGNPTIRSAVSRCNHIRNFFDRMKFTMGAPDSGCTAVPIANLICTDAGVFAFASKEYRDTIDTIIKKKLNSGMRVDQCIACNYPGEHEYCMIEEGSLAYEPGQQYSFLKVYFAKESFGQTSIDTLILPSLVVQR